MTGVNSMAKVGVITETLVARGYSDEDVLKILGGNFMRLLERVFPGC
jgi:microsomal dipeptidase-like Zn-dependent dipeptidase